MVKKGSWDDDRDKSRLSVTIPPGVKEAAKKKAKYSNITLSQIAENALREFISEDTNAEVLHNEMSEYVCPKCEALYPEPAYEKLKEECKNCDTDKNEFDKIG